MVVAKGIVQGIVASITTAIVGGIFLVIGIDPSEIVANLLQSPPIWLTHPLSRVVAALVGGALMFVAFKLWPKKALSPPPTEKGITLEPSDAQDSFQVDHDTRITKEGDYERIYALVVKNIESRDLDKCLVQVEEMSIPVPYGMPMPLVLRTEGQIRGKRSRRFSLSPNQTKTVPVLFRRRDRKNEWFLFDEQGDSYFVPFSPTSLTISVYGGVSNVSRTVDIETGEEWAITATIDDGTKPNWKIVDAMDYIAAIYGNENEENLDTKYAEPIRLLTSKARSGEIQVWGRRIFDDDNAELSQRQMKQSDWEDIELSIWACTTSAGHPHTEPASQHEVQQFTDLHVNAKQIKSIKWHTENT